MNRLRLLFKQVDYDLLIFRRNPAAAFFTVVLPLIFLFLFTEIFGNQEVTPGVRAATFYVPGILGLAIVSATAVNPAMTITARRERGTLKRLRGTPIPSWLFIASQAMTGFVISAIMTVLIVLIGRLVFDVTLNIDGIPSLIITVVISSAAFSAIGLALTTIIPSEDAAPAVTNAIFLPLYFVSDIFIVGADVPPAIELIGDLFPVKHLAISLQQSFDPLSGNTPWPWEHWLVIAGWGVVCALIAVRRFRWMPQR